MQTIGLAGHFSADVAGILRERTVFPDTSAFSLTCTASIGDFAFMDCSLLTGNGCSGFTGSLVLPEGLTSIGNFAFSNCSGLTDIKVLPTTPPTGGAGMFDVTNDAPIHVPAESIGAYNSTQYWNDYASRIQAMTE